MPDSRSKSLVERLLDNPMLPAYVQQLDSPTLGKLIKRVGPQDAQELIVLATPEQMQELVEMEAWSSERPGVEERFDPDRFLDWVEIWQEMGAEFMTAKLVDLGEEMLALTLQRYVTVIDMQRTGIAADYVDNFGPWAVLPTDEETWPLINSVIADAWSEESDFMERVLAHAATRYSVELDGFTLSNEEKRLSSDVEWGRESNRSGKGYVTPKDAALFLSQAKGSELEDLIIRVAFDPLTRSHLVRLAARRDQVARDAAREPAPPPDAPSADADTNALWRELNEIMAEAEIVSRAPPERLLAGPSTAQMSYLRRVLKTLGERNGAALEQRMDEIVYLANVLVAGSGVQGGVFTEDEAAKAVYATCNLGLEYCITDEPFDSEAAMVDSFLLGEPGLIKAFEIGYHLICRLPHKSMSATARELTRPQVQRRLREHGWIQEQLGQAIGRSNLGGEFTPESMEQMGEIFDTMSLLFDSETCFRLRALCDVFPCFPSSLEPDAKPGIHVDTRRRYITTPADLRRLLAYLEELKL